MRFRPTPSEDRWLALSRRLHISSAIAPVAEHTGAWRTANLPSRCAYFVLGLVAAGMISIITERLGLSSSLAMPGLLCLIVAEWLIINRRHFGSGIEEALEVAGLSMLAYSGCVGKSESVTACFLGVAFTIAGLRLLNPLLSTLAVLSFVLALDATPLQSALVCYGIGLTALAVGAHRFRRPSHDLILDSLVVVMPVAGYLWAASSYGLGAPVHWAHADFYVWVVPIGSFAFAAVAMTTGVRRRAHAPLVAFMLGAACTAYALRSLTGSSLATRLIVGGGILLVGSIILERYMRIGRGCFTSRPVREDDDVTSVLGIAGTAGLTSLSPAPKAPPSFDGDGGRFGGGGASGGY